MLIWIMTIIAVVVVVEVILLYLYIRTLNKMFHSMERSALKYKRAEDRIITDKTIKELRGEVNAVIKEGEALLEENRHWSKS